MAVTDDTGVRAPADGPGFDRTPPQDIAAEQSVLGGMLLSKDAIADVVEVLRPGDFYRPAHQLVYDAILDLYGRGEPADPVTVSAELTRLGVMGRIGGASYIHTLISQVPTAANAGYYAHIVAEQAILRRLVQAGTRIVQMGYGAAGQDSTGSVDEIVDRAQAEVYEVTERRTAEDYIRIEDLLQETMDEIDRISSNGGIGTGIPTGFTELDQITNGLHPGQMITVAGRPGAGKALALDTPLPTPGGWTTMGAVAVGDQLLGADGRPTRVVAATEVMLGRPCYEVEFSDGTVIVADAEHQWLTSTLAQRLQPALGPASRSGAGGSVVTTEAMASSLYAATDRRLLNHHVPRSAPLELPDASAVPHLDEVIARLLHEPEQAIPTECLRAPARQRRELFDAIAQAQAPGGPGDVLWMSFASQDRARSVLELAITLGLQGEIDEGRDTFRLHVADPTAFRPRYVVAVRPIESVPVRCVEVDNEDHLYLASRAMIPTHNSTLGMDFARSAAVKHGKATVFFSLEMSKLEIMMRLFSAESRIPLRNMRSGHMTDEDWTRMARRSGELAEAPLFIDDSPNLTMMEIRAKARRLKQRNDLQLIVIDYLQLMTSGKRVESRQQEVSEFSRAIKLLAKELEVPVIALSQLNRGPEQRTDKKPMLADLRESGSIEQDSDVVLLVHREDMYERESPRAGEADLIIAKHRNGQTGTVTVAFQGHYSRFTDLALEQ